MQSRNLLLGLAMALLIGCSDPPPPKPAPPAAAAAPTAAAAAAPKVALAATPPKVKRERASAEKVKIAQLFQIPEFATAGVKCAVPGLPGIAAPPVIRLVGFSRLDDQLRALVHVKGEIVAIEPGDVIEDVEVVSIDEEGVSFQYSGQRWTSRLFDKPAGEAPRHTSVSVARATEKLVVAEGNGPGETCTTVCPTVYPEQP